MTTGRRSGTRMAVTAALAIAAAVLVDAALPDGPPVAGWYGAGGTLPRLAAAAMLGALACLALTSLRRPGQLPARLRAVRAGLARPTTGRLRLLALAATEEAVWRACLLPVLVVAIGAPLAVALTSLGFGLWHVHQGARGVLGNCLNGAGFAGCYLLLGGLPAAIAAHVAYNFLLATLLAGRQRQSRLGARP